MRRLVCIGTNNFLSYLPSDVFEVKTLAVGPNYIRTWESICRECGYAPDVVAYCDCSIPPPLPGVELFPCLTVFFCIDSHIHEWYKTYAQAFDLCTVSLRDHIPDFVGRLTEKQLLWLPPSALAIDPDAIVGEHEKTIDVIFVGHVDPELMPQRAFMLEKLKSSLPGLVVTTGDWRTLFPAAKLVLNIAEGGDLNFRVFEALSVGSCLLTPEVGHGLTELFIPGEHLYAYRAGDVDAIVELAQNLLPDAQLRATIARQGLEAVRSRHSPMMRAQQFTTWLTSQPTQQLVGQRLAAAKGQNKTLQLLYLHWAEALVGDPRTPFYLAAAKGNRPAKE